MKSLYDVTADVKQAAEIVLHNMLQARPAATVKYRPYRNSEIITHDGFLGRKNIDVKKLYPRACVGDRVYIGMNLVAGGDHDIAFSVGGKVRLFYEDVEFYADEKQYSENMSTYFFSVRKGNNKIVLLCECQNEDSFVISFMPSTAQYPRMWARDYHLCLEVFSPVKEFASEEGVGISALIGRGEELPNNVEYVWPKAENKGSVLEINEIYPESKGCIAYGLSYALADTILKIQGKGNVKILVNNEETDCKTVCLKKDDVIILKIHKNDNTFEDVYFNEDALIGIPFLESSRSSGDKWLILGTFGKREEVALPFGPELGIQFTKPYLDCEWKQIFWKLNHKEDCIRPYVDSFFYSQWYYAVMVGHYGILKAGTLLESPEYQKYFIDSMGNAARFFEYIRYENQVFNTSSFMGRAAGIDCLDNTGSIAMNLCELYKLTEDENAMSCLKTLDRIIWDVIRRFEDGSFHREDTMWADDVFMCCPMLVRMGHVFRDDKYFKECITQIAGFKKRLWRNDAKLFSHILFLEDNMPNQISWSRGNGWIFVSLADLIDQLPDNIPGRENIVELFCEFSESLSSYQNENGLWHQVIDQPDAYSETSGSAMFLWGLSKGIQLGVLPAEKFMDVVRRAYIGLLKNMIDADGNVYGVCRGSGRSRDVEYYKQLGALTNDDHGIGLILAAFEAYSRVEKV